MRQFVRDPTLTNQEKYECAWTSVRHSTRSCGDQRSRTYILPYDRPVDDLHVTYIYCGDATVRLGYHLKCPLLKIMVSQQSVLATTSWFQTVELTTTETSSQSWSNIRIPHANHDVSNIEFPVCKAAFMGHIIITDGLQPNLATVQTKCMLTPTDRRGVRMILGVINRWLQWILFSTDFWYPSKNSIPFLWSTQHQQARMKSNLEIPFTIPTVLVVLQEDAPDLTRTWLE